MLVLLSVATSDPEEPSGASEGGGNHAVMFYPPTFDRATASTALCLSVCLLTGYFLLMGGFLGYLL